MTHQLRFGRSNDKELVQAIPMASRHTQKVYFCRGHTSSARQRNPPMGSSPRVVYTTKRKRARYNSTG
jgi:hypothetical protein